MQQLFEITGNVELGRSYVTGDVEIGHSYYLLGNVYYKKPIEITGNVVIGSDKTFDIYTGEYEVIPKVYEQVLETDQMLMVDDVTVKEITFTKVSNEKGLTAHIGEI